MSCRKSIFAICSAGLLVVPLVLSYSASGQQQAAPNGAAIFAANCAACHGSDGRGGERAPSIATRREVVSRSDADLIRAVQNGIAGVGMPAFGYLGEDKVKVVVNYLRTLQGFGAHEKVPGNPHSGEALFYGKAGCVNCHMMNGKGGFLAGDLTQYGLGRSVEGVRTAIIDPDRSVERRGQSVTIVRMDDQRLKGLIRAEDNFSLVLQTEDGAYHTITREQIVRIEQSGHSLMPQDYENRLSSKEIDDLVSYLLQARGAEKPNDKAGDED